MAREPPSFALVLGLGIGCSIVMSGLVLQGEQHRRPLPVFGGHSRNSSRGRSAGGMESTTSTVSGGAGAGAAISTDCTPNPSTLQAAPPLALPTVTPERRRLAPTEFVTPPSPALAAALPQGDGDDGSSLRAMGVPDPVLARLVSDFDYCGGENDPSGCSSIPYSCSKPPPPANASSGSDKVSAEDVKVPPAPWSPSATYCENGGSSGVIGSDEGRPAEAEPDGVVESATYKSQGEDSAGYPPSASESSTAGRAGEEKGERHNCFRGGAGDGGGSESGGEIASGGVGDLEKAKAQRVALPKKDGEVDVPDGEWRR